MQRDQSDEEEDGEFQKKNSNALPLWGNEKTMNLNNLVLTNIQSSHYFKVNLFEYKTYHEVIDEIYYKVNHPEPWEKGSRKTGGQTGMCGGVRGVGVGGIVSTAFSCLYKLFTLRLTRKQVNGLLNHADSPYLRGLGFMYLRYTQPPAELWSWFEPYLEDDEVVDVKAGGGEEMMMGVLVRKMMTKLDWYGTLFPRIPVPIQMKIQKQLQERFPAIGGPQVGDVRRGAPPPPTDDTARRGPPPPRERERTPSRERQRPPRDIAEEIAMEKERIRREQEGSRGRDQQDSRGRDQQDSRGRDRPDSRGRDQQDSRGRDGPDSRGKDRQGSKSRDHRDSRGRDHQEGRGRDHRDARDHHDTKSRDHRDSKTRDHQDDRRRDQQVRSRDQQEVRGREQQEVRGRDGRSPERTRERHRSRSNERRHRRSQERRAGSRKERVKRSRSRERRKRSRSRDRELEKRHRRSGSREQRR